VNRNRYMPSGAAALAHPTGLDVRLQRTVQAVGRQLAGRQQPPLRPLNL